MSIITIVGAGMMGSAMNAPALTNGHEVRLVGTPLDREIIDSVKKNHYHPTLVHTLDEKVIPYQIEELDKALDGCDLVLSGVSSFGVEWFAQTVLPKLKSGARVLAITKGLHAGAEGALIPYPTYLNSLRPDIDFMAVGGPCICFELQEHRHTLIYFCGKDLAKVKETRALFATDYYHIIPTDDVIGVETGVAMKNAYAMGVSLAVGLSDRDIGITDARGIAGQHGTNSLDYNPRYNPQAALFGQSCIEMSRLTRILGGNPRLISGLPGAGDLYVTVFGGRTRRLGTLLGRGMTYAQAREVLKGVTLESVAIITKVAESLRIRAKRGEINPEKTFPLLMHMDAIINRGAAVEIPWENFGSCESDF